jgi:HSP20 family molecular chaperone IbpA
VVTVTDTDDASDGPEDEEEDAPAKRREGTESADESTEEADDSVDVDVVDSPEERPDGIRLELGVQPLSGLLEGLGSLVNHERVEAESTVRTSTIDEYLAHHAAEERAARRERARESAAGRGRTDGTVDPAHVQTQYDDGEFVVVADLFGADIDDVSAGIDTSRNQLIVKQESATVARVDLPWPNAETTGAWFNNGVLEIRLREAV